MLMLVTFFRPFAGLSGLLAVTIAIAFSYASAKNSIDANKGLLSYNALLLGVGMGTFYNAGIAFWLLLLLMVILSVILSGIFLNILGKRGLPLLAIPFVLCFWLVILVSREFAAIDLTTRNIYWLNEMYAIGESPLLKFIMFFENLPLHPLVLTFFKSLSSLFFQDNVLGGMVIFIALLIHSRIATTLLIAGFLTSIYFNSIVHAYGNGINYYLMGGNFIMVTIAVGSFFLIPSFQSYLWAILCVPITFIIVIALGKLTASLQLPVYSMPFCIVTIMVIFFLSFRQNRGKLLLTPLQLYSPERNLYNYLSTKERLACTNYIRFHLPFLGEWIVSQGYDGSITHKGDWSKALDFVIVDADLKTYTQYAIKPENFYCYNKPVLAPANGFVTEVIDHVEDNEIGKINQADNWGNTIVIKHAEGLYTKMCHLRKNSFKVRIGDYVKQGDVVAACGNSGRSPEPHLHFQVQVTPYVGSKTLAYPFASYNTTNAGVPKIAEFSVPEETQLVNNVVIDSDLSRAFQFLPGSRIEVSAENFETTTWEVFTDAYNISYIYCHRSKALAYFKTLENLFYFISFDGDQGSLLYYFYLSCYKISFSVAHSLGITDKFPLQLTNNNPGKWLQDLVAPFYIFRRLYYQSVNKVVSNDMFNPEVLILSSQTLQYFSFRKEILSSQVSVRDGRINSFNFTKNSKTTKVICTPKG